MRKIRRKKQILYIVLLCMVWMCSCGKIEPVKVEGTAISDAAAPSDSNKEQAERTALPAGTEAPAESIAPPTGVQAPAENTAPPAENAAQQTENADPSQTLEEEAYQPEEALNGYVVVIDAGH